MNEISFPLSFRAIGPKVSDLQIVLQSLVDKRVLLADDDAARPELVAALQQDRAANKYGEATRELVTLFQRSQRLPARGEVDKATAQALNQYVAQQPPRPEDPTPRPGDPAQPINGYAVTGFVRFDDRTPASGTAVSAFDLDFRSEQLLNRSRTLQDGSYKIKYSAAQFSDHELGTADIVVRAFDADGSAIAASQILFNAPQQAYIDLTIPLKKSAPALFDRIGTTILPLIGRVSIKELEENSDHQDIGFLSGETGFQKRDIARFVLAHHLVALGVETEFWFAVLGGSVLEYTETDSIQTNLARVSSVLPGLDAFSVHKAINQSFSSHEIRDELRAKSEAWIKEFLGLAARETVNNPASPLFLKMALDDAGIADPAKREEIARRFNERKVSPGEALTELEKQNLLDKSQLANLRTSYTLAELTDGNSSMVKAIKEEFKVRRPDQIRVLAKQSERDWADWTKRHYDAGNLDLPYDFGNTDLPSHPPDAEMYGRDLAQRFREAFPTAAFAGGLERAIAQPAAPGGIKHAEILSRFLEQHPTFELLTTSVDKFLSNGTRPEFRGLAKDEDFKREIKAVQRVFKLAPTFEATNAILADGVHSAQMVYRMGESEFVRRYSGRPGLSSTIARTVWNRAADTHAAVLTLIGDLKALDHEALPKVLRSGSKAALETFPNWNNLFQSGDICHCEQCRSVLSPAAYFADILMFLKDRKASNPAFTVKDILFKRRPDLGYLELNCENANTPLPYVDIVCEVLESAIAADGNDIELVGFANVPAGGAPAKAAVASALATGGVAVGADFSLTQIDPADPNRWVVHGEDASYLLKKKATANFFAQLLPNTKASKEELRSYPAYVNPRAYDKVRQARFPFALPFDLYAEEVRAAFLKCDLQRWDLMRNLRGTSAPNNPSDGDIAAEYFGISSDSTATIDEKRLITLSDATAAGQQAIWGETGNAGWLTTIANVKTFLGKSRLEYEELLTLLDLEFINSAQDISIQHTDASCDTDKKTIHGLNADKLDRIHRFLRLWRKLGAWTMWELDLALQCPGVTAGPLNEAFLVNLYYFDRLKTRLGAKATVSQVCGLFADLSTNTHFTELHEKRAEGFYQSLFLNKKLIQPLDTAFEVGAVNVPGPTIEKISGHRAVILAALGIREADLDVFVGLRRATNAALYITDDLTLANLSFLWRHAWLAKLLKFKAEEWKTILKLLQQDVPAFADSKAAWEFVEKVDQLKGTGYTPDALGWLLAADRQAKAAVKESDAARFLSSLRKELQAIRAEFDTARYDFLEPPSDSDRLAELLTSLLQRLHRDEAAALFFVTTLRDEVTMEHRTDGLPAGFKFPASITGAPNNIRIAYEPTLRFTGTMTPAQKAILLGDASLNAVTGLASYQKAIGELSNGSGSAIVSDLPTGFAFPATITGAPNNIPIRYEPIVRFRGFMTAAQQTTLLTHVDLSAVNGIATYQSAIQDFFTRPRLALKFLDPVFTAPLAGLPAVVDFGALQNAPLALRISYDPEERTLRVVGILSASEKQELDNLSADPAYRNAVNSLFTQPGLAAIPPDRVWLQDADLTFPLRDLTNTANDNLNKNLAIAITKALAYLLRTLAEGTVVQLVAGQLGLSEGLTRRLLTSYKILPETLLEHLTQTFAQTSGVVDYATLKTTFDAWFWATRVAAVWKKWKLTLEQWERLNALTTAAQLLDMGALPLDSVAPLASTDRFVRTSRLVRFKDSVPEPGITLLEVLEKLNGAKYATALDFAGDVQLVNDSWRAADAKALVDSIDLAYPNDYLLAETWERVRRAFSFVESLNAGVTTVETFAAPAMKESNAKTTKALLRSKFGTETWLTLSADIQDVLRESKRDALAAYMLSQPQPADAPTGKWENDDDLYAYYLLDVEMEACQLTSRLVQASGSVQLFVQRCFMGLEPDVAVQADGINGDSAWRWWTWMRKYRVWEANRKVFLWPENWIEPELKKDRSSFFKDLEKELLQNEINQFTVETAFSNYLEKLDGVAQLELAGFYQQDDGADTIVHTFGRTRGAEPHIYYYRRYDYRLWTPWEKVDLDIQGDYLVPAVVNQRLFLFWPIFTEVPDEQSNSVVNTPTANDTDVPLKRAFKKLKLQMAVSDYRQGKWTPKRVSKDFDVSEPYNVEIVRDHYRFFPVDRSDSDGRFAVCYDGSSTDQQAMSRARLAGAFEISGCHGIPELAPSIHKLFRHAIRPERAATGYETTYLRWQELPLHTRGDSPEEDFTFEGLVSTLNSAGLTPLLDQTPGIFKMTPAWDPTYFDRLWVDMPYARLYQITGDRAAGPVGLWAPFFFADQRRSFFVLPTLQRSFEGGGISREGGTTSGSIRSYYPDIKRQFRKWNDYVEGLVRTWADGFDLGSLTPAQRTQLESVLANALPGEKVPPFTDNEVRDLLVRFFMRLIYWYYLGPLSLYLFQAARYEFRNFYHPFVCDFAKQVQNPLQGIRGLMKRETQLRNSGFSFKGIYRPTPWVVAPSTEDYYPKEIVDFAPDGAYAPYNWELFFHAPLLIANALNRNQRFEEARDWYHFIFNPIGVESAVPGGSPTSKYWITKPFFETTDPQYVQQRIENILRMLAGDTTVPGYSPQTKKALEDQVVDWRTNPFEPHRIANYRTVAYQKTVVMKYVQNLIDWGDYLFRQDSMESINEATQLYILAAELLGPAPKKIPPESKPPVESFNELEKHLDVFSNALVEVENLIPQQSGTGTTAANSPPLPMLYFCIPRNEKMLGYWDLVADRLYKIRHCMNIAGVVRQLALFEPPIDPGALVKAVAGGVDISAALADLNAPLPLYRFNVLLQKANEVCNDVKALGGALLSALEKNDAEALSLLRQTQEARVLEAVKMVHEKQIEEAKENLAGTKNTKELTEIKRKYYETREFMNAGETVAVALNTASTAIDAGIAIGYSLAGGLKLIPDFVLGASGFGGSPHAVVDTGGASFGDSADELVKTLESITRALDKAASISSTLASYQRRQQEWDFQKDLAVKELEQIDKQIAAAELRVAIAERELENQVLQIENSKAIDSFMRSKYTNQELYQWQLSQISGVYFQSYKLAYDLAKRAERCFRFELGVQDSSFINFGYWDSLKKGLQSGERLQYDLRRLDTAYLEQNRREFELTKHISLALLDPLALVKLRETGRCFFRLPEEIFDLDYPGHYFRRTKSVSLTLPGVAGPNTTIACTLRLLKSCIRINARSGNNGYPRNTEDDGLPADDDRFVENNIPVKSIATSSGQNDSGVFELNFRDDRYLPFEGAGVISDLSLELFTDLPSNNPDPTNPDFGRPLRQFDYGTITDAVLHVKYTAREDAGSFKNSAIKHLREYFSKDDASPSALILNLRRDFPSEWSRFLKPTNPANGNVFELDMSPNLFPIRDSGKTLKVNSITLLARCTNAGDYTATLTPPLPAPPPLPATNTMTLAKSKKEYGGLHFSQRDVSSAGVLIDPTNPPVRWNIKVTAPGGGNLTQGAITKEMEISDLMMVLGYEWD